MRPSGRRSSVRLSGAQLNEFLGVLDHIDHRGAAPRFAGRMGTFLRQYKDGHLRLASLFRDSGDLERSDGAISGSYLGPVTLHPLVDPKIGVLGFPLGEVADTFAISEELGGIVNVVMWLKSPMANAANDILKTRQSIRLDGDFRWTPTARLAVGAANVDATSALTWKQSRSIKAVADDVARPPHALEYILDYRMGSPGMKFFRSMCVVRRNDTLTVLPAFAEPTLLAISDTSPDIVGSIPEGEVSCLLAYREPWDASWTAVESVRVTAEDALSHVVSWADYQLELRDSQIDGETVAAIRKSWLAAGLPLGRGYSEFNIEHRLLPIVRAVIRELRRI